MTYAVTNNTPWILMDRIEYKETGKTIDGKDLFYLFVYITMSKEKIVKGEEPAHVFINFEFFPKTKVEEHLNLEYTTVPELNEFITIHGSNIGDKVVHMVEYKLNKEEAQFEMREVYSDTEMLDIMKQLISQAKKEKAMEYMHTVVYKPIIDARDFS